jgi:hypothetical protein
MSLIHRFNWDAYPDLPAKQRELIEQDIDKFADTQSKNRFTYGDHSFEVVWHVTGDTVIIDVYNDLN